ncbi:MAG: hypothetical protein Kow0098_25680 [Ignavibacteriaceae bacterium]
MKIIRMNLLNNGKGGKTLAFFDIETDDGIIIKGFRLINGSKGMFLSEPDEKGKDGRFHNTVALPKEMKDKLLNLALEEYERQKKSD